MKEIALKIRIDDKNKTVELRRTGCKVPEFMIFDNSAGAMAEAWRALAAYAMENAFLMEHSGDFCPPSFTNEERRKMAARITEEYKNILTA